MYVYLVFIQGLYCVLHVLHLPSRNMISSFSHTLSELINEAAKGQAEHDPLYAAIVDYSEVIQYEAFKEGVLTALSLLPPFLKPEVHQEIKISIPHFLRFLLRL